MTEPDDKSGLLLPLLAAAGLVLVALALRTAGLSYNPSALALLAIAAVAALVAGLGERIPGMGRLLAKTGDRHGMGSTMHILLALGAGLGIVHHFLYSPGITLSPPKPLSFRAAAVAAGLFFVIYLWQGSQAQVRRWLFPALLASFAAMGAALLFAAPQPLIDTWLSQQGAARAILHGTNPYQLIFPNIYGDDTFYGPGFLQNGRVVVFGYLPLVPLLEMPAFFVAGDVRWMLLGCMLVSAWALGRLGGRTGELAALAVLFQPGTFLVLELAWTEPIVMAAWVLALLLAVKCNWGTGRQWAGVGVALGMLVASKQYSPLLFLPLAMAVARERRWHVVAVAALAFAVVTLPFVVWDPAEFWRDVVVAQFLQPFRMDGLSFLTAWAWATGVQPSSAIGFVLAGAVLLIGLRGGVSLPRAAAIAAAAFLTLVLFSKQAMFNYFWLSTGLLASVIAAWSAEGDRRD